MKCKEVQENISSYLDQELAGEENVLIQKHLENCCACQEELLALRETISLFSSLEEVTPPVNFRRELCAKLEKSITDKTKVKKKGQFVQGFISQLKAWSRYAFFYPVVISLVFLIIFVPVFGNKTNLGSKHTEDIAEQEMMSYGLSMEQSSAPREAMKSMVSNGVASELGRGVGLADQNLQKEFVADSSLERKLIKNAEMFLAVDNYERSVELLKNKVSVLGGYITNERVNAIDARGSKTGYLEVRIPQIRFEEFLVEINSLGKLKKNHIYTQNVTEEYIDVESRLKTMRTKEVRLLDILDQAGKLSDILAVENELANTRAQLESLEGRLRYLSNQTEFSTFNMEIEQVVVSTQQVSTRGLQGLGVRAKEAFIQAINNIFLGLGVFFVFISTAIPYIVVVAVVVGLVWGVWCSIQRRKK